MNQDEKIAQLLSRLEKLTQVATQQQIEIALLRKELSDVVSQSLHGGLGSVPTPKPEAVTNTVTPPVTLPVGQNSISDKPETPVTEPVPLMQVTAPGAQPGFTPPPVMPKKQSAQSMEAFIGGNVINKIGILILVIGLGIFVKYAIDNNMIGPVGRIAGGYLAGLTLVGLSYWLKKNYASYSAVLLSGGVATLYFTTYFAYDFYALLPHTVAFVLMVAVTLFTVYAATSYNQQVIGVIGLVGAYAVPLLLSQDSGRVAILFTYMGMINIGVAAVSYYRKWAWMNITAFLITWIVVISWFVVSFDPALHLATALGFGALFFLIFYAVFVFYQLPYEKLLQYHSAFIVTNTLVFFLMGQAALEQAGYTKQTAFFSLALAAVHAVVAWLMQQRKLSESVYYLAVGLALLFVTIAVELYFDGFTVALLWATEAVVLCWVALRARAGFYFYSATILLVLSTLSLFQVWEAHYVSSEALAFLTNRYFFTGVGVVVTQLAILWMLKRYHTSENSLLPPTVYSLFSNAISVWSVILLYLVISLEIRQYFNQEMFVHSIPEGVDRTRNLDLLDNRKQAWLLIFSALYVSGLLWISKRVLKSAGWQVAALVLGSIVVIAWFGVHLEAMESIQAQYLTDRSLGRLMSLRYIAYAAVAVCLFLMYQTASGFPSKGSFARKYLPVLIHFFVVSVLSFELRNWVMQASDNPVRAGERILKAGVSILWGCYALGLTIAGIRFKSRTTRLIGILLLGVTLVKLFLMDLANISQLSKIIAFVGLGILLLIIAFLYQRFKDVILAEDE